MSLHEQDLGRSLPDVDSQWEWSPEVRHQFNAVLRDVKRIDDPRLVRRIEDDLMALMHETRRVLDDAVVRALHS